MTFLGINLRKYINKAQASIRFLKDYNKLNMHKTLTPTYLKQN